MPRPKKTRMPSTTSTATSCTASWTSWSGDSRRKGAGHETSEGLLVVRGSGRSGAHPPATRGWAGVSGGQDVPQRHRGVEDRRSGNGRAPGGGGAGLAEAESGQSRAADGAGDQGFVARRVEAGARVVRHDRAAPTLLHRRSRLAVPRLPQAHRGLPASEQRAVADVQRRPRRDRTGPQARGARRHGDSPRARLGLSPGGERRRLRGPEPPPVLMTFAISTTLAGRRRTMAALALKIVLFVLWTVGAYAVGYRQAKRGL